MNIKKALRIAGTAVAILLVVPFFALPASAAALPGTASIAAGERDILAGATDTLFHVTVNNPGTDGTAGIGQTGAPLNLVEIAPPRGDYTITAASATGWTATISSTLQKVVFDGSTIGRGGVAVFTIQANVTRPVADSARDWTVNVSSDGGDTGNLDTASSSGALTTTIHILKAVSVELTAPSQALDNAITQNQPVAVRERVQNAGSGSPTVTPSLSGGGQTACSASEASSVGLTQATPSPKTIGPQSESFFDFCVKLGSTGSQTLTGGATSSGSNGFNATSAPINVQTPASFTYVGSSLSPTAVIPGRSYAFQLNVSKSGDVAVPSGTVKLCLTGTTNCTGTVSTTFAGGSDSKLIQFPSLLIPTSLADGQYTPTLTISGSDENAFPVSFSGNTDQITLDRLIPTVSPTLTAPASQVTGAGPAVKNGDNLSFGGNVSDGSANAPCGTPSCTVATQPDSANPSNTGAPFLRQFDAGGNAISGADISGITVTLSSTGALGGAYTGNYAANAQGVELFVDVVDKAGNHSGYQHSGLISVDNIKPFLNVAYTGGRTNADGSNPSDNKRIDACWDAPVANTPAAPTTPADWTVDGNNVTAVTTDGTPAGYQCATLTLANALDGNATPTVTFAPKLYSVKDHVGLTAVLPASITPLDRIVPGLPTILTVGGFSKQGDGYYTNQQAPVFAIGSVANLDTVSVYRDVNNNGTLEVNIDELLGQKQSTGAASTNVQSKSLGTLDQNFQFLVAATDSAGNFGQLAKDQLFLDFTAPTVLSASASGSTITVTFSEILGRGRDKIQDWAAVGRDAGNNTNTYLMGSVTGTGATRVANVNGASGATLTQVLYEYLGSLTPADPNAGRYQDRAGNDLANFTKTIA